MQIRELTMHEIESVSGGNKFYEFLISYFGGKVADEIYEQMKDSDMRGYESGFYGTYGSYGVSFS